MQKNTAFNEETVKWKSNLLGILQLIQNIFNLGAEKFNHLMVCFTMLSIKYPQIYFLHFLVVKKRSAAGINQKKADTHLDEYFDFAEIWRSRCPHRETITHQVSTYYLFRPYM
jgi:hypothetical protein